MDPSAKIAFACPSCSISVRVAIQHAGKKGKCPSCGSVIQIPAAPPKPEEDEEEGSVYSLSEESSEPTPVLGHSKPLALIRRGWKPYQFRDSQIVVLLPETIAAGFGPDGVLYGSSTGRQNEVSATLHDFKLNRSQAIDFVGHLARQRGLKTENIGTYRYFFDPTDAPPKLVAPRFWVIGIPGAVVVISIDGQRKGPVSEALAEVKAEMPFIVGELL